MKPSLADKDLPGVWRDADATSLSGQKWTLRYSRLRLGGSLLGAVGGAISSFAGIFDVAAVVVLLGFFVALSGELAAWVHRPEETWYEGRAVAESAKTLAWRYAVAADPFPASLDRRAAHDLLRERMSEVVGEVSNRIVLVSDQPTVTDQMLAVRGLNFEERRSIYIDGRTRDQQRWYARKATANRKSETGWRIALVVAEVVAIVLAALRISGGWEIDLAGLMAAVIAAGAAWISVKQYSPLASAYSVAAAELAIQSEKLRDVSEEEWSDFVADAEEAISREHTMWLASRTGRRR